jgi:hypothetical protein
MIRQLFLTLSAVALVADPALAQTCTCTKYKHGSTTRNGRRPGHDGPPDQGLHGSADPGGSEVKRVIAVRA